IRHSRTRDGYQLSTNKVKSIVVELLFRQAIAGKSQLHDWHTRSAVGNDERWRCPGRQLSELRLGTGSDLRNGSIQTGVRLQEDFDDSDDIKHIRCHVFDFIYKHRYIP